MELVVFRAAAHGTPLWTLPNHQEGRYNRAGEAPTTYLGLHPLTPWAERLRAEAIHSRDEAKQVRLPVWALRLRLESDRVVEIDFTTADQHGLSAEDLVGDDHTPCQALAASLRALREPPAALVVPSAALPGTRNVVLLGPHVPAPYLAEQIDDVDVPVSVTAVAGRAPEDLVDLVHHRFAGTTHAALEAWRDGEPFELDEPPLTRADRLATAF